MPELVVRLRVAGDKDVKQALDALGAQAQDVGVKILGTGQSSRQLAQETREARRAMGDFSQTLSGVSGIVRILAKDNPELQATVDRLTGAIALGSTGLVIYRNASELATSSLIRLRLAAIASWAAIAGPVVLAVGGLVLFAKVMADLSRETEGVSQDLIDLNVQLAQSEAAFQNLSKSAQDAAAHMRGVVPQQALESGLRTLEAIDRLQNRPIRKAEVPLFTEEGKAEDAARRADQAEQQAKRRKEAEAAAAAKRLEEARRQEQQMIQLRAETAAAIFQLQGRSFDAELVQLTAAYQAQRLQAAGNAAAQLALDRRFWAQRALLAKQSLEGIARQAQGLVGQIRDVDMAILGVRKEFFGITPQEQIAALEAMKKTLDPTKDADRITQINRELLGINKDLIDSYQQQSQELRARAAAEGVTQSQQTAMLARARDLEETAARLRLELPAKAKALGQEVIEALTSQRAALLGQVNELRNEFASIGVASAQAVKTVGDQFTALGQHMVKAIGTAVGQVNAFLGGVGRGQPFVDVIPPFKLPAAGVPFPGQPPAISPALAAPARPAEPFILIDAPGFGRSPGAVTSAVSMEKLLATPGGDQLVRVLEKFIEEGGGKGITVQLGGLTVNLDSDEERIFRKFLERIASMDRRTPTPL
jgi:hypothetical protein